ALARILLGVMAGCAVGRRKGKARHVRARRLDLDHLSAEILQGPCAERARQHAGEVDDAKSAERSTHLYFPANLASPGPFLRNEARPVLRSSDAQIGAWILGMATSAASTPSLTAMWTSSLVAACASVGPCANSSAIDIVAVSSCSSGTARLIRPHFSRVGAS